MIFIALHRPRDEDRQCEIDARRGPSAEDGRHGPTGDADEVRRARRETALLGAHDRHHVGSARRDVHLDEALAQQEQRRRDGKARGTGPQRGSMDVGEDHRVDEADPASEPGGDKCEARSHPGRKKRPPMRRSRQPGREEVREQRRRGSALERVECEARACQDGARGGRHRRARLTRSARGGGRSRP